MAARQYVRHSLDVYGVELFLATTPKAWKQLRKALPFVDRDVPESAGMSHFGVWHPDEGVARGHVALWVDVARHGADLGELIDTLAHEATHAAGEVLDWIGHPGEGSDEPRAYLTGWLTRWLWDHTVGTEVSR